MTERRTHPDGRYYGETRREFRARLRGIDTRPVVQRRIMAIKFEQDVKNYGLAEAMRMHGIKEDA